MDKLRANHIDQIAITDANGKLEGVATTSYLLNKILNSNLNLGSMISTSLFKKYVKVNVNNSVGKLSRVLEKEPFAVIVEVKGNYFRNESHSQFFVSMSSVLCFILA